MWPRYLCFSMIQMRIKFLNEILTSKRTITEVATLLSVSRQSISKWLARYRIEWEAWVVPRKSWPRGWVPVNRTDATIESQVTALGRMYPLLWPIGIAYKLQEETGIVLNQSTVYRILRRNWVRYKNPWEWRQRRKTLYALDTPGRELQVDVCFPFGRMRKEVQYDAIDDCSRFVFSRLHTEHSVRSSMEFVWNLIHTVPFHIRAIRTDCGGEFWPGFTEFLKKLNIQHILNAPYSPQHNGKVERYHRTLWQHLWAYSLKIDAQEYRLKLKLFEDWYNYKKPHTWLWMFWMTPVQKLGYCLVQKTLQTQRESEEPWGLKTFLNVNLTLQFNNWK